MFVGDSSNPSFPFLLGDHQFQYDSSSLPRLQLFADYNSGRNIATLNYTGKNVNVDQTAKKLKEAEPVARRKKLVYQNDKHGAGHSGSIFNPRTVSTGLKLAYEEDERNSSISSVSGGMTTPLPAILSLNSNLKNEADKQNEEFDQYIKLQTDVIIKGVKELQRRHTAILMSEIEKGIGKKLQENDLEIENMNHKNKELEERIKQVMVEVQSWQNRAKYSEFVINVLKKNLQQVMAQGQGAVNGKEGCGDSEVGDSASFANPNHLNLMDGMGSSSLGDTNRMSCKACKVKVVSVLFLPCRHLCLCKDCEGVISICPICQATKYASVEVHMS